MLAKWNIFLFMPNWSVYVQLGHSGRMCKPVYYVFRSCVWSGIYIYGLVIRLDSGQPSGQPSGRPLTRISRDAMSRSSLIDDRGRISTKLATNIQHVGGHCWMDLQSQKWKVTVTCVHVRQCYNAIMAEALPTFDDVESRWTCFMFSNLPLKSGSGNTYFCQ